MPKYAQNIFGIYLKLDFVEAIKSTSYWP